MNLLKFNLIIDFMPLAILIILIIYSVIKHFRSKKINYVQLNADENNFAVFTNNGCGRELSQISAWMSLDKCIIFVKDYKGSCCIYGKVNI